MENPEVSVIIPVYNRKLLLNRAVDSVLGQTCTDLELIIVDDGSTDGTDLTTLASQSQKIMPFTLDHNCGVSTARNFGVAHSHGRLICFLDSDDLWHPCKLAHQVAWMLAHPETQICQTQEIWIRNGVRVNPPDTHKKKGGDIFEPSLQRCMITPSAVMMTRTLFEGYGGFNEALPACEDYDLWLRIACTQPVGLIDEYLVTRYGGHEDQLSNQPMLDLYRVRALLDLLAHGNLNDVFKTLVRQTLKKKAQILATGFKKRGKEDLYEQFKNLASIN